MRILLIEDNDDDACLIREALSEATTVTVQLEWLDRMERGLTRLSQGCIDAVLLDLSLSDSQGLATFDTVHAHAPEVPIVVLTGMDDEVTAIEAVHRGAQDYLAKKQLDSDRLVRALRYAMERHRVERQLRQSTEQLRALTGHLETVREQERTRIARELHDELGQMLTGLKMDVSWLSRRIGELTHVQDLSPCMTKTQSMTVLIDETIVALRRLVSELRPAVLDHLGLVAALEWQAEEFHRRTGLLCQFVSSVKTARLDSAGSTAVFRIVQEALTNVMRHAKASRVTIRLEQDGQSLCVVVADDGKGISDADATGLSSFGIMGLRERVALLGGHMTLKGGGPSKGTTLTAHVPLASIGEAA